MSEFRFSTDNVKFPPAKPAHLDFADVNYNGDWMKSLDKIGFCCVVVQWRATIKFYRRQNFVMRLMSP